MTGVRLRAARALVSVARGRRTLAAEVDLARRDLDDERDRGLLLELTAGVCRWRAALDAVLERCSTRPLVAIDEQSLAVLRVALYQLRHLDRIPAHAVVHSAVDDAKQLVNERAGGFVNGVLRGYLRAHTALALPGRPGDSATRKQRLEYLSVTLSHPRWLVARWLDRYGFDATEAWCEFNNRPPDPTVRALDSAIVDTSAWLREQGVEATASPLVPDMARLAAGALGAMPASVREGLAVQDDGSALVADVLDAHGGDHVLDVCASPGGKSVRVWRAMQGRGVLISADARPARVHLLRQTLRAAAVPARVVLLDGTGPLPFGPSFDRVLVDAPCSGLGILRRDPDLKWSSSLDQLPALAATQLALLRQAAQVVKPGGLLTYATCSSEPDENEAVVAEFLNSTNHFVADPWTGPGCDRDGTLRTTPPRDGVDAFFAARLRRVTA